MDGAIALMQRRRHHPPGCREPAAGGEGAAGRSGRRACPAVADLDRTGIAASAANSFPPSATPSARPMPSGKNEHFPGSHRMNLAEILRLAPVIPVVTIEQLKDAVPLARALVKGGLPVIEVTLRTGPGWRRSAPWRTRFRKGRGRRRHGADRGAIRQSGKAAGAQFAVSPGATGQLLDAVSGARGAAAARHRHGLGSHGADRARLRVRKIISRRGVGRGGAALRPRPPLPQLKFCPTGGVTLENAPNT